jgi:hypothetical protein
VKSSGAETAGEEKLHPAKIKTNQAKIKITRKTPVKLILLFIPHYCSGMQGALIFRKKILKLHNFFQDK